MSARRCSFGTMYWAKALALSLIVWVYFWRACSEALSGKPRSQVVVGEFEPRVVPADFGRVLIRASEKVVQVVFWREDVHVGHRLSAATQCRGDCRSIDRFRRTCRRRAGRDRNDCSPPGRAQASPFAWRESLLRLSLRPLPYTAEVGRGGN
jgi:hypothetical protein